MNSIRAFHCENIPIPGECASLSENENKHIFKVLRAKKDDEILLMDGRGTSAFAKIANNRQIEIVSIKKHQPPTPRIKLFVSPPRHSGIDSILASCAETAVAEIIPIICEHSVATSRNSEKWRRKIVEDCKQSKNPFFPLIHDTKNFDEALKLTCDDDTFYGDPNAEDTKKFALTKNSISWFVGPEGGFSSGEITMMKNAGFKPLKLSPVIMRIESAALAGIIFLSNQFSTENTN